jgi:hypothetical protein
VSSGKGNPFFLTIQPKEMAMEKEKSDGSTDEMAVLDEGIDPEAEDKPNALCCTGALSPLRR